ncbi:MAG TPA: CHRD domain-containing protein [Gaiellaceae bacterium]
MAGVVPLLAGSAFAAPVRTAASPPVNSSLPAISGTAREGQTLTTTNGSWSGVTPITYAYQWQRCNAEGSSCGSISKATNQNYVASSGDVAKTIRVEVTATNADGQGQALSAASSSIAASGNAPANTKQPNPSGTAQDGNTISVDSGAWTGLQPITFTYQWQSCKAGTSTCTNLTGVTGSSFVISTSLVGTLLRATILATNAAGKTSATSNATAIVIAKLSSPVNVSRPTVSGSASVGNRLTAASGTWTGATNFSYQWSRCNTNGSACASINGATGQTYGVGTADRGMALRVTVTATNTAGSTRSTSNSRGVAAIKTASFNAVLRSGQEVSRPKGTSKIAAGHFTARVTGKTLRWTLTFSHLSSRPTVARLNKGVRGVSGAAFKSLCYTCRSPVHGTVTLTAAQLDMLLRGRTYVNLITKRNTHGEIRGQIIRVN